MVWWLECGFWGQDAWVQASPSIHYLCSFGRLLSFAVSVKGRLRMASTSWGFNDSISIKAGPMPGMWYRCCNCYGYDPRVDPVIQVWSHLHTSLELCHLPSFGHHAFYWHSPGIVSVLATTSHIWFLQNVCVTEAPLLPSTRPPPSLLLSSLASHVPHLRTASHHQMVQWNLPHGFCLSFPSPVVPALCHSTVFHHPQIWPHTLQKILIIAENGCARSLPVKKHWFLRTCSFINTVHNCPLLSLHSNTTSFPYDHVYPAKSYPSSLRRLSQLCKTGLKSCLSKISWAYLSCFSR